MKRRTLIAGSAAAALLAACQSSVNDPSGKTTNKSTTNSSAGNNSSGSSASATNSEIFSDERVRKAIAYAIDVPAILSSLYKGMANPANTLVPKGPNKPESGLTTYEYNPDLAKQLLKDAGWDPQRKVNLVYYYGDQVTVDFMSAVQQYLAQVGMQVSPRKLEGDLASQLWAKPDDPEKGPSKVEWDLAYAAVAAMTPYDYYNRLLPDYSGNSFWPSNPELTRLIKATSDTLDPAKQAQAFQEVAKWDNAHLPAVPLYYQPLFVVVKETVDRKGAEYGNEQFFYDWKINTWDMKPNDQGKKVLRTNGGPQEFFETPFFNPAFLMSQKILWDRLIVAGGDLVPKQGQLAESYKVSKDGLTVDIVLRDNLKWHDGKPLTSEDVKFTFELAGKVATINSVFAGTIDRLAGVQVNGKTVQFKFKAIDPNALVTLSQLPPLPKHLLENADPLKIQQDPYFQNPIGSGPFRLTDVKIGNYAVAEAWDGYWAGRPTIDAVRMYPSGESDPNLIKNVEAGEVDYAYSKSVDDAAALEDQKGIHLESVDVSYTRMFWVNSFPKA